MSNVTLEIGGRTYRLACAEGEEEHISRLGASIDAKLAQAQGMSRQSETQTLLYAALLLADELHESASRPAAPPEIPDELAERLENCAEMLESLADQLESRSANA